MATLDDQLLAAKRAVSKLAFAVIFRQSSDLVAGQSFSSFLGHCFGTYNGVPGAGPRGWALADYQAEISKLEIGARNLDALLQLIGNRLLVGLEFAFLHLLFKQCTLVASEPL
jgi:hypothetical protein